MMRRVCALGLLTLLLFPGVSLAQTTQELQVRVQHVLSEAVETRGRHVIFEAIDEEGTVYRVDTSESYPLGLSYKLREGQKILVQSVTYENGEQHAYFVDVVRVHGLLGLVLFFALLVMLVGGWRGLRALIGLGVTLLVLFGWIVPGILHGGSPVGLTVLGSMVILAVNILLTHGVRRAGVVAFFSTVIGLGIAWLCSVVFVAISHLSGVASEEMSLLLLTVDAIHSSRGLLLAGMILGAVGVLDDIAITQVETVSEIWRANTQLTKKEVFTRAMNVGRHHIASVVNTLVMAYAAVALPLFLLFSLRDDIAIWRFLNEELIADELIRTLAGTAALVLLVPLATWLATLFRVHETKHAPEASHGHTHG